MKRILNITLLLIVCSISPLIVRAQINTEQVMNIGKNALYFEDYVLSIQYFNQVIKIKPYLADPYFFRGVAKFYLEDYRGAEADCSLAIERNPFITDAYQVRGISRQILEDYKGAIEDYKMGLKYLPEEKVFLLNKAVAEQELKDYENSEKSFETLMGYYPRYDNAYLGRAQLYLESGDTIKALADVSKSIELNDNNANAFVMRADINIKNKSDYQLALEDMNSAIKLKPKEVGYFINRAFLKYNLDDYFGAMSDFDYAISLDGSNVVAHLNRGLLRTEVQEDNKAIEDFSFVINREPENYMAIYNRGLLYKKTKQYEKAIVDFNQIIDKYPSLTMAYYERSDCKRMSGDMKGAEKDYNKTKELNKHRTDDNYALKGNVEESDTAFVMKKFKSLVTVDNDNSVKLEYDNKYRGKVQNYNAPINMEEMYYLSYYNKLSDLQSDAYYQRDLDDLNSSHYLRDKLYLTNNITKLTESQIQKQFELIGHFTNLILNKDNRAVDYFGRGLSYIMVKNYDAALDDLNRAVALNDGFVLAHFAKAMAMYSKITVKKADDSSVAADKSSEKIKVPEFEIRGDKHSLDAVVEELNRVIELSPKQVYAHFNKGNIYYEKQDFTSALACYTEAVKIKPDFGEAYYNRGMVYLQLGNMEKGVADLSKAGELGILSSYNILKRMSR